MSDLSAIFLPLVQSPEFKESLKSALREVIAEITPPPDPSPVFYTRVEVSKILHISLATVDRYIRRGILDVKKVGNRFLFPKESLQKAAGDPTFKKYRRRA